MAAAKISEGAQLVIPQQTCRKPDLPKGRNPFPAVLKAEGLMTLRPTRPPRSLRGYLKGATPPADHMLQIARKEERKIERKVASSTSNRRRDRRGRKPG